MTFDKRSFILAASLVLASGAAFAQAPTATDAPTEQQQRHGKRGFKGGGAGRIAAALNLTDAQKEQAKAIHEKHRASSGDTRTQMRDLRERAQAAKQASNTAELDKIKQERETLFAKAKESWDAERAEIRSILTAEQQAKFDQMGERRSKR